MKKLLLVRHAKSSWADPGQADFDRPLNERGKHNAPEMGQRLLQQKFIPDLIVSSPAKRAIKTARLIAAELQYDEKAIEQENSIYDAHIDDLKNVLKELDNKYNTVMLVGHNPGISHLAMLLTGSMNLQMPTCGMVYMELPIKQWQEIKAESAHLLWFDYPKKDPSDPD